MRSVFIIAEAGVNHNGDIKIAEQLVDAAAVAGADAIKFQAFKASELSCSDAPMAEYQIKNTQKRESQLEMLKRLELNRKDYFHLLEYCNKKNIIFILSAFDLKSIDLLVLLDCHIFKIPSGEITNVPYLEKIGRQKKRVILSTGMADMAEIKFAVNILGNKGTLKEKIALLHCCTDYPALVSNVNLNAMKSMAAAFPEVEIGYSDHTKGYEIAIAAVAMGATIIEKHMTLDQNMKGPDHKASIEPKEFKNMVNAIRNVEKALGDGVKQACVQELDNLNIVRKSIVAACHISKGDIFKKDNMTTKRPGNGLSPVLWYDILGKKAKKDFMPDEQIFL